MFLMARRADAMATALARACVANAGPAELSAVAGRLRCREIVDRLRASMRTMERLAALR
jgi:hypothetical protein